MMTMQDLIEVCAYLDMREKEKNDVEPSAEEVLENFLAQPPAD